MENPLPEIYKNLFSPTSKFNPKHLPLLTRLLTLYGKEHTTIGISRDGHKQKKLGMCFKNSIQLALRNGYEYCHGYAMSDKLMLPVERAWCWDKEKQLVIDVTWDMREGEIYYYGLHIHSSLAARFMARIGIYGLDFWRDRDGGLTQEITDYLETQRVKENENTKAI